MFFDDMTVGFSFETERSEVLSEADIIAFAKQYDPQPFHIDPVAAKDHAFGGLIASGLQTMGIALKLIIDAGVWAEGSMGSPGLDEVRWTKPVRPGDSLKVYAEVLSVTPSRSKPDRGSIQLRYDTRNQNDETVMHYLATLIMRRNG